MATKRPDISQQKALEQAQEMLGLTDAFKGKDVVKGTGKKQKKKRQPNLKGAQSIQREINSVINLSVDAAQAAFGGPKSFQ